jgi:hypothetical protein
MPAPPAEPPRPPQPTQLQIDVYQIETTIERMAPMDLDRLSEGQPSRKELLQRLAEFGTARLLVQWHTATDLANGARFNNSRRVPVVKEGSPNSRPGVNYESIGATLWLEGAWREGGQAGLADVDIQFEASGVGKSNLDSVEEGKLPTFDTISILQRVTLESGRPTLMMYSGMPEPGDEKGRVTVTVLSIIAQRLKDQAVPTTRPAEEANVGPPALIYVDVVELTAKSDTIYAREIERQIPGGCTLEQGLAAIRKFGAAEVLSSPRLLIKWPAEAKIQIGERVPFVGNFAKDAAGKTTPQMDYRFIGLSMKVRGRWLGGAEARHAEISLNAERTSWGTSTVSVAAGVTLPTFSTRTWETVASLEAGKAVWLTTERPVPADKGKESLILFRITVDRAAS